MYTGSREEGTTKPISWLGDSLRRVRTFFERARQLVGYELEMVQHGLEPSDWKPMPGIGRGVNEIRTHVDGEHRVFYVARFSQAIYVLHAFRKKSRKTAKAEIDLGKSRYHEAVRREELKS